MVQSCERPAVELGFSSLLADLTLEQKIGQMTIAGFPGTEPHSEIERFLGHCHAGGVMLSDKNIISPVQTRFLIDWLQEIATKDVGLPLFVTVDHEGGSVSRLGYPVTVLPTAMAVAATGSVEYAKRCAEVCAAEMRAMGFNVNFAPVLDVNSNHANPVIGVRSYGDNPDLVAAFGAAAIEALQRSGIIATAKHFPGHGDTSLDSHLALPIIGRDLEELQTTDLPPFVAAIEHGVGMIMTAHATFPRLSRSGLPATLSADIIQGLLRQTLGFDGLVVTDALVMDAVADSYSLGEASILAVEAGADVVLMLSTIKDQLRAFELLVAAVKSGRLSEERIDESVLRILEAKSRLPAIEPLISGGTEVAGWPVQEHQEIVRDVARRSITLVRNQNGLLPIRGKNGGRVGMVEFASCRFSPVEDSRRQNCSLASLIADRFPGMLSVTMDAIPTDGRASLERVVEECDIILIATRNAHLIESQARLVRQLIATGKPAAVIALRNPYDLLALPEADCYVATYGDAPCQLQAARDLVFGEIEPSGRLPVALPGLYARGYGQTSF